MSGPTERPQRATRHCRHYSYERGERLIDGGPRCALGIDLSAPGAGKKCWPDADANGACPKRADYSDDERATWNAWVETRFSRLIAAIGALPRPIPLNRRGSVECPSCGGRLSYERWHRGAAVQCSTEDCCGARFNVAAGADWPAPAEDQTS